MPSVEFIKLLGQNDNVVEAFSDGSLNIAYIDPRSNRGELDQTDFDFINSQTLTANGEVTINLRAPGGDRINGQAKSSGQYTLKVRWLDETFSLVREEGITANRPGGEWSNFALDPKSPFLDVVIEEDSGVDQTADATGHYL